MSYIDLATKKIHRKNELEGRINEFLCKCRSIESCLQKLKTKAIGLVNVLECNPEEFKDRFLSCMNRMNEYMYFITETELAFGDFVEDMTSSESLPVQDKRDNLMTPLPASTNLLDTLSDPLPSCSRAVTPKVKVIKKKKIPKEDQLLIAFSSESGSEEHIPVKGSGNIKCDISNNVEVSPASVTDEMAKMCINGQLNNELPAQNVLECDQSYEANIIHIDGTTVWIILEVHMHEYWSLLSAMMEHYKNRQMCTLDTRQISNMTYCAFYDDSSNDYHRALVIGLKETNPNFVEVLLLDTGEVKDIHSGLVQPLNKKFWIYPPFARSCYLAGIEIPQGNVEALQSFMNQYLGNKCLVQVDDNISEDLGVYIIFENKQVLNKLLVQHGYATEIDKPTEAIVNPTSEFADEDFDITDNPEYDDPVEAVAGYSNRDEAEICKHYKGGPEKTCFKGLSCKKRHVLINPDGWTLDRVPVAGRVPSLPLPAPGSLQRLHVTCVAHYDSVFVVLGDHKADWARPPALPPQTLADLIRDMNSPAARAAYKRLPMHPAVGELVAALYPQDNLWYRARVHDLSHVDSVEVMYIDYGAYSWVRESSLRTLDEAHLALPAQATRCRLAGVAPLPHTDRVIAASKALEKLTLGRTFDARIISREFDQMTVELLDDGGRRVVDLLAESGYISLAPYEVEDDSHISKRVLPA